MTPQSRDRWEFLSTPSARRATRVRHQFSGLLQISIHALREEGDSLNKISGRWDNISIHALREEGDLTRRTPASAGKSISIHALREEGDPVLLGGNIVPPLISIHALREEGDAVLRPSGLHPA